MSPPTEATPAGRSHEERLPRPGLAVVAVIAVLVVAIVGAVLLLRPKPTVAVIGDSITYVSRSAIQDRLDGDWSPAIDGRAGFTVAQQLPAADAMVGRDPEQVIINLGTNDVNGGEDLDASLAALADMVGRFPEAKCIHLVTVSEMMFTPDGLSPTRSIEFNDGVRALAATDPRIRVIDWTALLNQEMARQPGVALTDDTVHPTAAGQVLLADAYRDAVESCE